MTATHQSDPIDPNECCREPVLFIGGAGRSGTTFFLRVFSAPLGIPICREPHFILRHYRVAHDYEPLSDEGNLRRFLRDLLQDDFFLPDPESPKPKKRKWPHFELDDLTARLPARTYPSIVYTALRMVSEVQNAPHVGAKYPPVTFHLDLVARMFPQCKVIHVVRDGRDVALSTIKAPRFGPCNLYTAALAWATELRLTREQARQHLRDDQYLEVHYEQLLQEPVAELERIAHFAGWPCEPQTLDAFEKDFDKRAKRGNYAKWRSKLSERQNSMFETLAGETLQAYGYPLVGRKIRISAVERAAYVGHHYLRKSLQYGRQLLGSPSQVLKPSFWRHLGAYFSSKRVPYTTGYEQPPDDQDILGSE